MDNAALLGELRALANSLPDFDEFLHPDTRRWLAKGYALLALFDSSAAFEFKLNSNLALPSVRAMQVGHLLGALERSIAALELRLGSSATPKQVFGPGAVYDLMKNLRDLIGSAQHALLIVDPYMDDKIFDAYLSTVRPGVTVRLLAKKCSPTMKSTLEAFAKQHGLQVKLRTSAEIHDRVFFVDGTSCWVLGQSVAHAAQRMPTYLAPLAPDVGQAKLPIYEDVWNTATPIT